MSAMWPAHVRQQQHPCPRALGHSAQMVEVDLVVGGDTDEHRISAGVDDRAGHRCQSEGVHEHRLARSHADCHEAGRERRSTAVECDAVLAANQPGEGHLQLGHIEFSGTGLAVAE